MHAPFGRGWLGLDGLSSRATTHLPQPRFPSTIVWLSPGHNRALPQVPQKHRMIVGRIRMADLSTYDTKLQFNKEGLCSP